MYLLELIFHSTTGVIDADRASHVLNTLFHTWRMNGQIAGREWGSAEVRDAVHTTVLCPESTALASAFDNSYVHAAKAELAQADLNAPLIRVIGKDIDGLDPCDCPTPSTYVLSTNYLSLESPVRCGACFQPVPLYRLPRTQHDEYADIVSWQSDYQACDSLFMNSQVLERVTHREMSSVQSSLATMGRRICQRIEQHTRVPTYYALMKHLGRRRSMEQRRSCPSCGGQWALPTPWHHFDFRCDPCRLVANIAWSVR